MIGKPTITDDDHAALQRAEQIDGAHYGTRLSSMTALFALAEQREQFERRIADLTRARHPEPVGTRRNARLAPLASAAIVIALVFYWLGLAHVPPRPETTTLDAPKQAETTSRRKPVSPTAYSVRAPSTVRTAPSRLRRAASSSRKPASPRPAKAKIVDADKGRTGRTTTRSAEQPRVANRGGGEIAVPLHGEALRKALEEDRRKTRSANRTQYTRTVDNR